MIYNVINHFNVDPYWQYILRAVLLALSIYASNLRVVIRDKLDQHRFRKEITRLMPEAGDK